MKPSAEAAAAYERLVRSVVIGGDEPQRFAQIRLTDDRRRVVFPVETVVEMHRVVTDLSGDASIRARRSQESLIEAIRAHAQRAAERALTGDALSTDLAELYATMSEPTGSVRSLFVVAPRIHFWEASLQIGRVLFYRATDEQLRKRWPEIDSTAWREDITRELKDRLVAEVSAEAEPIRAQEIAGRDLTLALALLGLAYTNLYRDWPATGLLPSVGAHTLSVNADGSRTWGAVEFFDQPLMQYPRGYLPAFINRASDGRRLGHVISDLRRDEVDSRLLTALSWWSAGNEVGAWAMRFVKYVTVFEALFNRTSERYLRGKGKRLARRVALIAASRGDSLAQLAARVEKLYDLRSDCVHEGAMTVSERDVYEVMRVGANCIGYLARSTMSSEADLFGHIDEMDRNGTPWIDYGWTKGIDPSM